MGEVGYKYSDSYPVLLISASLSAHINLDGSQVCTEKGHSLIGSFQAKADGHLLGML